MPKLNNRLVQILIHSGIWLGLFFYPFLFHYLPITDGSTVFRIAFFLVLLALFFYVNSMLLIPRLLGNRKVMIYFIIVISIITAISFISGCLERCFNPMIVEKPMLSQTARVTAAIASFLVWMISSLLKITGEWFRTQQLRNNIEHEKVQAELSFLKTQVNPHFLFNALNNIYALENKRSPYTGEAILRLSDLARYMLYETSVEFTPLDKEVAYLTNYVELQKLGIAIPVTFTVKGETKGKKIEPLLLVPLVENAFKHGVSYESRTPISIQLTISDQALFLRVENGLHQGSPSKDRTNGIGLVNLRKRLEALYPGKYILETGERGLKFIAELKIELKT